MKKDVNELIRRIRHVVNTHELSTGEYARWIWQPEGANDRDLGINAYGCADAANILYTIGDFPSDSTEREKWINALQNMQDKETGLYYEGTHHTLHTTAHCLASLELFDKKPIYPLTGLDKYKTKEGLYDLLENLQWVESPWNNSHQGAGIYAALNLAGEATPQWNKWYFDWFWEEMCPECGMWRKDYATKGTMPMYTYMAGSFHYLFNHEHARMPIRYPEKMIDTCIDMYLKNELHPEFYSSVNFIQADWVYCVTRALRQCGHRFNECKELLTEFADKYIDYLMSLDPDSHDRMNDLHLLFGSLCCIAELQQFLKGQIISDIPLKLVLDRRPFI